jgi:TetR/AcrR family transcriptional regulator, transcriptional repressor for nem operon
MQVKHWTARGSRAPRFNPPDELAISVLTNKTDRSACKNRPVGLVLLMAVESRAKLIRSSQVLMMSKGYSATGVDDICRDAGVSKGAFYHQFSSKEELAIAALGDFYEVSLQTLLAIDLRGVAPEQQLLAFLDAVAERGHELWKSGCLFGSLASEMALASPPLQAEVARLFSQTAKALEPLTESFVVAFPGESLSAAELAEHFLVVVEGAIVMSRAHHNPTKINQAVARFAEQLRWLTRGNTAVQQHTKKARKR